jgi:ATP-dependent Clp protease adaptor protein ClpS
MLLSAKIMLAITPAPRQNKLVMADPEKTAAAVKPKAKPGKKRRRKNKQLPPFNVVLLDDDDHTYDYVVEMLRSIFSHTEQKAFKMAEEVDNTGRVIVFTTHRELAELKRDQIHAFGADSRIASCQGSMTSVIEPAN